MAFAHLNHIRSKAAMALTICCFMALFLFLVACSDGSGNTDPTVDTSTIENPEETLDTTITPPLDVVQQEKDVLFEIDGEKGKNSGEPLDLSGLNNIMTYAALFELVSSPFDNVGREITLTGYYTAEYFSSTDEYFHYINVNDENGCCGIMLELVWKGEHIYPADYPEYGTTITLSGTYGYYYAGGYPTYCLYVEEIPS